MRINIFLIQIQYTHSNSALSIMADVCMPSPGKVNDHFSGDHSGVGDDTVTSGVCSKCTGSVQYSLTFAVTSLFTQWNDITSS